MGSDSEYMLNDLRRRWRFPASTPAMPLALLLLAMTALFLLGHDRASFYREGHHDWNSSQTLAFAENLSFRHSLLIFHYQTRDADGNPRYSTPYSRFPPGGYILVKLAILPFGEDAFQAKIYAGRMLMLLLFAAAAALAYLSLARIIGSRWDALTATMLAFSSYYVLYYADKISNEVTLDLFAVMLTFHGMVVFGQEGRFRQLLVKACLALLLGWHVYAFLLPFILFGLTAELLKAKRDIAALSPVPLQRWLKGCGTTLLRSRYCTLGLVTLLFGVAVLTFNLTNEYLVLDGEVPLEDLPAVESVVKRFSGNEQFNIRYDARLEPETFVPEQFYRIMMMSLPYAANPYQIKSQISRYTYRDYPGISLGILTVGFCLAGLAGFRRRPETLFLLATLVVSGFCWALPLRTNVINHDFESVFYIGIPLVAFSLALLYLRRLCQIRLEPILAVAALGMFVFSAAAMAGVGQSRQEIAVEAEQMADYAAIRELVDDHAAIYIPWRQWDLRLSGAVWADEYFLAGKTLIYEYGDAGYMDFETRWHPNNPPPLTYESEDAHRPALQTGDYLLLNTREANAALLTPENRHVFLYDWTLYRKLYREANLGTPIIAGNWNVYLRDDRLTFASAECVNRDQPFFMHFIPRDPENLPYYRKEYGYYNEDFTFGHGGIILSDGTCVVERLLPEYDFVSFRTGQYRETGKIWEDEYRPLP